MRNENQELKRLARHYGIQTHYLDVKQQRREASAESLVQVLQAWGVPVQKPEHAREALRQALLDRWRRALEPVVVVWDRRPAAMEIRLPAHLADRAVHCVMRGEDGLIHRWDAELSKARVLRTARVEGMNFVAKELGLPGALPWGYHHLDVETVQGLFRTLILSSPSKAYADGQKERIWGVFVPCYAVHTERSWGAGDFKDLGELTGWAAEMGAGVVATLPLLPAFLDKPLEPSPYSPVSRLFWNEFYLDVEDVVERSGSKEGAAMLGSKGLLRKKAELREKPEVDYRGQMALKRKVIEACAREYFRQSSMRREPFDRYLRDHPLAEDYARFRAAGEARGSSWREWPQRLRQGKLRHGDYDEQAKEYHLFVQWMAHEQMQALADGARNRGVKLYLDMPLGVHTDGYDVWREQEIFALEACGGAPPDAVFTKGQNWGFAPLHPQRLRDSGYRYMVAYLRHHMRHATLLRIDHVMGLHRLYWVPNGCSARDGAYVEYPAEEWYAILSIESHLHRAMVAGENLGTVPPAVNASLRRHEVRELYVGQYEQRPDAKAALREVPRRCVASMNTHDMPPFAGFWEGRDLETHHQIGLLTKAEFRKEREARERLNDALTQFLRKRGWLGPGAKKAEDLLRAYLAHLSASRAEIVLVNLEDLWLETEPQNLPGTSQEQPNWRRRSRYSVEEVRALPEVAALLAEIDQLREGLLTAKPKERKIKRTRSTSL